MSINLPPGVSLHPNSSTRNRVQPTGDFVALPIRGSSPAQSAALATFFESTGLHGSQIDPHGQFVVDHRNSVSYGQFGQVTLGDIGASSGEMGLRCQNAHFRFLLDGSGAAVKFSGCDLDAQSSARLLGFRGVSDITSPLNTETGPALWVANENAAAPALNIGQDASTAANRVGCWRSDGSLEQWGKSSTSTGRQLTGIVPSYVDSTDATRKARAIFKVYDTAAREALRLEASGSAAMIGFLGASAIVRPASTTDLRQAVIDLGLYTTGGATPLNLNGGTLTAATIVGDCTGAVSLTPGSDTRNRVQPTGDFIPFSVRAAVGQTSDLFVAYASDGTTKLTRLTSDGTISSPGSGANSEHFGFNAVAIGARTVVMGNGADALGDDGVAVGFGAHGAGLGGVAIGSGAIGSGLRATALGASAVASGESAVALGKGAQSAGLGGIAIGLSSATGASDTASIAIGLEAATTAPRQMVLGGATGYVSDVYWNGVTAATPQPVALHAAGGSGSNIAGAYLTLAGGQGTGSAVGGDLIFQSSLADGSGSSLNALHELMRLSSVGVLSLTQLTSVQDRTAFDFTPSWATATDASRKARAVFKVYDTAAREALRLEASGSAAMLGVLGAPAIAQQAATADLKDSFCGFGFQVNGGATPLDLDGGSMTAANYATAIATKTANYAMVATDGTIYADATSGAFSVTLPTPVGVAGRIYTVKKIDTGSNVVTVLPNGVETLDFSASVALTIPETTLGFQSDNANWRIV